MKRNYSLKTIALLALFIGFTSCSKDDDVPSPPRVIVIDPWIEFLKEYGLDKVKQKIESVSTGLDTSFICFNGRLDQKLWVGYYNKNSKEKVFEWTEPTKLDTILNLNIGYGEFKKYTIEKFQVKDVYKDKNIFCFILWGFANDATSIGGSRTVSSNLYFF